MPSPYCTLVLAALLWLCSVQQCCGHSGKHGSGHGEHHAITNARRFALGLPPRPPSDFARQSFSGRVRMVPTRANKGVSARPLISSIPSLMINHSQQDAAPCRPALLLSALFPKENNGRGKELTVSSFQDLRYRSSHAVQRKRRIRWPRRVRTAVSSALDVAD